MPNPCSLPILHPPSRGNSAATGRLQPPRNLQTIAARSNAPSSDSDESPAPDALPLTPISSARQDFSAGAAGTSSELLEGGSDARKRKRHRKSRLGCFQCKRRKIKCSESRPTCAQCSQKGLSCIYTTRLSAEDLELLQYTSSALLSQQQIASLQPSGMTFNSSDMRLHHHFLINAYPHHPIGNDKIWTHYITARADKFPHLLHAMLALAASNLGEQVPDSTQYDTSALTHRITAINGVNAAMASKPLEDFEMAERDALLGACYALCFQSNYLEDGMLDFVTMVRGCGLIVNQIRTENLPTGFQFLGREQQREVMLPRLLSFSSTQPGFLNPPTTSSSGYMLDRALTSWVLPSVTALHSLVRSEEEEYAWEGLVMIAECMDTDPIRAYLASSMGYSRLTHMSSEGFAAFISPENVIGRLLMVYMLSLLMILHPIASREWNGRESQVPVRVVAIWIRKVCHIIEDRDAKILEGKAEGEMLRDHMKWPMAVAESIDERERLKRAPNLDSEYRQAFETRQRDSSSSEDTIFVGGKFSGDLQ